jgi:uncharacterized membrane protein
MLTLFGVGLVVIGFATHLNPPFMIAVAAGLPPARIIGALRVNRLCLQLYPNYTYNPPNLEK